MNGNQRWILKHKVAHKPESLKSYMSGSEMGQIAKTKHIYFPETPTDKVQTKIAGQNDSGKK